jgi:hypothetical protein
MLKPICRPLEIKVCVPSCYASIIANIADEPIELDSNDDDKQDNDEQDEAEQDDDRQDDDGEDNTADGDNDLGDNIPPYSAELQKSAPIIFESELCIKRTPLPQLSGYVANTTSAENVNSLPKREKLGHSQCSQAISVAEDDSNTDDPEHILGTDRLTSTTIERSLTELQPHAVDRDWEIHKVLCRKYINGE